MDFQASWGRGRKDHTKSGGEVCFPRKWYNAKWNWLVQRHHRGDVDGSHAVFHSSQRRRSCSKIHVMLSGIQGDGNEDGLIRLQGGNAAASVVIVGVKSETGTAGKQQNAIVLDNLGNMPVVINGVYQTNGVTSNSVIQIINGAGARVQWSGIRASSNAPGVTNILDDQVNGITIPASSTGANNAASGQNYTEEKWEHLVRFFDDATGDQFLGARLLADVNDRFSIDVDGGMLWGGGAGVGPS